MSDQGPLSKLGPNAFVFTTPGFIGNGLSSVGISLPIKKGGGYSSWGVTIDLRATCNQDAQTMAFAGKALTDLAIGMYQESIQAIEQGGIPFVQGILENNPHLKD